MLGLVGDVDLAGPAFDLTGVMRRIRRIADVSQRQLAARVGTPKSTVAAAESGAAGLDVRVLARAAALAGLRLALLSADGSEVAGMAAGTVRDRAGRHFPAHLDTRYGDEDWWHGHSRYSRQQPWYTFDRARWLRDQWRRRTGTPEDHQMPQPGDSPEERKAARQRAARRRAAEEWQRRLAAGVVQPSPPFECTCPPRCDDLDDRSGPPVHADDCTCLCDVA